MSVKCDLGYCSEPATEGFEHPGSRAENVAAWKLRLCSKHVERWAARYAGTPWRRTPLAPEHPAP